MTTPEPLAAARPAPPAGKCALGISVVLPGYNEEANVEDAVSRCLAALRQLTERPEVIVVDDGSTDATFAIAEELGRRHPEVRVVRNPINLGVGTSLLIGMQAASGDLVLYNGMDYSLDLADLAGMLPLFPEHDVVVVVRTDRSAHAPWRKLTSLVHYWLVRLLFRARFGDMNFTQVYKRELAVGLGVRARSPAFVTPELLIRARDRGARITEVRARFLPRLRGPTSYGKPRDILWALTDMFSFWLERRAARAQRP